MKKIKLMIAAGMLMAAQAEAQWYGQNHYFADSTILVSAKRTFNNVGYVMAGHRFVRQNGSTLPDFLINKVDAFGNFSSPNDFIGEYQIFDNCNLSNFAYNCTGVSIAECATPINGNEYYVVVATYDYGLAISTLDNLGNPIKQIQYPWAGAPLGTFKPKIRESFVNPGVFYVCCTAGGQAFVAQIDINPPAIVNNWSFLYSCGNLMEGYDLIESPYNPADLVVIGRCDPNLGPAPNSASDGFFMMLNSGNGVFNAMNVYNKYCDGDDWLTCIEVANSPTGGNGYVLGGRSKFPYKATCTSSTSGTNDGYQQWMCKLDPNGNVIWSSLIEPFASQSYTAAGGPPMAGEIGGVIERYNSYTGYYEYFGVGGINLLPTGTGTWTATNNLVVYKLDDNGLNSIAPNEFHYTPGIGNVASNAWGNSQLTGIETGLGPDDGFQAFGNQNTNYANYHMVKAYFNGVSGCKEVLTRMTNIRSGPTITATPNAAQFPINPCNNGWSIIPTFLTYNPNVICTATSVTGGSNMRPAAPVGISSYAANEAGINVHPNPANSLVYITKVEGLSVQLFNNLGQKIATFKADNLPVTREGEMAIDLKALNIEAGVYYLDINSVNGVQRHKLIYTKD